METYYKDENMCAKCGGSCCKTVGCIYSIRQFYEKGLDVEKIKELLKQGTASIAGQPVNGFCGDAWTFILYLKARDEGADVIDILGKGGPCSQLTDKGCKLPSEERPMLGKTVKPTKIGGTCEQTINIKSFVYDCLLFNNDLAKILEEYTGMETEAYLLDKLKEDAKYLQKKIKDEETLTCMEKERYDWYLNIVNDKPYVDSNFALNWMNSCMGC